MFAKLLDCDKFGVKILRQKTTRKLQLHDLLLRLAIKQVLNKMEWDEIGKNKVGQD